MILIGIDPHKSTHTATAVDPTTNKDLGSVRIDSTITEYRRLLTWAKQWPAGKWAVENADGLGHHIALWLLALGEVVLDVPPSATARVRQLSRGGRRKNDRIDAAAAACVAALQGDARPVQPETHADSLALLSDRRNSLSSRRTRTVNQLHTLLRELSPGGAAINLSAPKALAALRSIRPLTATDHVRKDLARELINDIKRYDTQLAENSKTMTAILDDHGTTLQSIPCIGPVLAARILGNTGRASRFPSAAAYANYTGTSPVEVASADSSRHCLSRYGNRSLNSALHTAAVVQIRMGGSAGRAYYDRKIAEGKSPRDAKRCLKRRLADLCWRTMIRDEKHSPSKRPKPTELAA